MDMAIFDQLGGWGTQTLFASSAVLAFMFFYFFRPYGVPLITEARERKLHQAGITEPFFQLHPRATLIGAAEMFLMLFTILFAAFVLSGLGLPGGIDGLFQQADREGGSAVGATGVFFAAFAVVALAVTWSVFRWLRVRSFSPAFLTDFIVRHENQKSVNLFLPAGLFLIGLSSLSAQAVNWVVDRDTDANFDVVVVVAVATALALPSLLDLMARKLARRMDVKALGAVSSPGLVTMFLMMLPGLLALMTSVAFPLISNKLFADSHVAVMSLYLAVVAVLGVAFVIAEAVFYGLFRKEVDAETEAYVQELYEYAVAVRLEERRRQERIKAILDKLRNGESVKSLSPEDRALLASYLSTNDALSRLDSTDDESWHKPRSIVESMCGDDCMPGSFYSPGAMFSGETATGIGID